MAGNEIRSETFDLRKEVTGGFNALVMSFPGTIAFGTVVFAPLGPEMAAIGILTCFLGAFLGGLLSTVFGVSRVMITGPRSFAVVILAGLASLSFEVLRPEIGAENAMTSAVLLVLIASFLSGLIQLVIGLLKFGNLIKLIPFPIVSGLMNLSALLVILTQIWPLLGLPARPDDPLSLSWMQAVQPLAVLIGLVTIAAMAFGSKYFSKFPPIVFAATIGISAFYCLETMGLGAQLGQRLPVIEFDLSATAERLAFLDARALGIYNGLFLPVLLSALSLAALNSLSTLVTGLAIHQQTARVVSPSRELVGHGIANMIASLFGGVASTGKTGNTQANIKAGARNRTSSITTALGYGVILVALMPVLAYLPRPVLAGIAIYLSIGLFDAFGKNLLWSLVGFDKAKIFDNLGNMIIVFTVLLVGLTQDMMLAISAGLILTILEFVSKSANAAIGQVFSGQQRRSRVQRSDSEMTILQESPSGMLVLQLQGDIFFVVAERLSDDISRHAKEGADYLILDVRRVSYLDQTGVTVLLQLFKRLKDNGKRVLVCGANSSVQRKHRGSEWELLLSGLPSSAVYQDLDKALEWCENAIIESEGGVIGRPAGFSECGLTKNLSEAQSHEVEQYFELMDFEAGSCLFKEGDRGDRLYLIASGTLDVLVGQGTAAEVDLTLRLQTYTCGSLLGEMSLIDNLPRSATVMCRTNARCYVLARDNFERLQMSSPGLALTLMANIAAVLASRLRSANLTINQISEQLA
jgi:SulP family sulfate permease